MLACDRFLSWTILAAILLLAAFLRFWQLDALPPGLYHDEAYNGLDALSLLDDATFPRFYEGWELYAADAHGQREPVETRFPLFFEGNYGREPLHVYLMAASVALFGETPFALRAVPAAAGVLAVLTTYLAAGALLSSLFERRTVRMIALLAAFFLAILYPAVHFSRFAIRAMVFVPVETMAVACFWWAVNRQEREQASDPGVWFLFLAAGFFLGLGIYTFAASRLLPLVWLLFVPLWFWLDRRAMVDHWLHILAMAGVSLLTALPLLTFFARYPYYLIFRIAYVANKGKGAVEGQPALTWLLNTGRVARGLIWQGETHLRHNLPGRPYLDPIQAVFFLLGLVRALWQVLQPRTLFLLIWFGVMLLPSVLSGDAPHFGRLSGAAAPVAILAALGAHWLWRIASDWLTRIMPAQRAAWLAGAALALLLAVSAALTIRDYFGRYAVHSDLAHDFQLADWDMGRYAASTAAGDARLFLSPTQEELATIYFALGDPDRLRNYNGSEDLLPAGTPGLEALYMLRSGEDEAEKALLSYFPRIQTMDRRDGFAPFKVEPNQLRPAPQAPMDQLFAGQIRLLGWSSRIVDDTLAVQLTLQAESEMDLDYTAFLHLTGAEDQILAQVDQAPAGYPTSDWVPGEIILLTLSMPLPANIDLSQAELRGGFYYLPALEPLGETVVLAKMGELRP